MWRVLAHANASPPVVVWQDRGVVVNQQVFHLGYDGKLPVVQHLGQIGAGLGVGKFHWRQRLVVKLVSNSDIWIVMDS